VLLRSTIAQFTPNENSHLACFIFRGNLHLYDFSLSGVGAAERAVASFLKG
jgi:hypothetical protein